MRTVAEAARVLEMDHYRQIIMRWGAETLTEALVGPGGAEGMVRLQEAVDTLLWALCG